MRKINILILALLFGNYIIGQTDTNYSITFSIRCVSPLSNCTTFFAMGGVFFYPLHENKNIIYSLNFSNQQRFYLSDKLIIKVDGIELSKEQYFKLNLKQNHVYNRRGFYDNESLTLNNCDSLELTKMFISLTIPIKLNEVELLVNEREGILKKIKSDDIVSVRRKKSIFGKSVIEIVTK